MTGLTAPESTRATPSFLGMLFVLLASLQLLVYRDSFAAKPSNDDFIALHQVDRGEKEGVGSFFMRSDVGDYRPLQNATFWLFGRWSRPHTLLSLRVLHFASFAFYAVVALLWVRALRFSRRSALVAMCVVFFHPTLAGALAGFDNYSRLIVSAWVWLGAWVAHYHGSRPLLAVPLVSLCFAIGLGYMEYAIALIPLAVLGTAWRVGLRRPHDAGVMFVSLVGICIAYFMIRVSGMVATTSGTGYLSLNPLVWARNGVMILVSVLFFGNTVPIMLQESLPNLAWLGSNVTLVGLTLGYGLWADQRRSLLPAWADPHAISQAVRLPRLPLGFLGAAFGATFFPMLLMTHISEIYLTTVTLGLALLAGGSADGWKTASRPLRRVVLLFAGTQVLLAANAIQGKVAGINDAGDRADAMIQQLLSHLPDDGAARRAAIVFLQKEVEGRRGYSVFAMPDDQLVLPGYGTFAMQWFRPHQDVRLDQFVVGNVSDVDLESYDLVLLWDGSTKRLMPMARSTSRPRSSRRTPKEGPRSAFSRVASDFLQRRPERRGDASTIEVRRRPEGVLHEPLPERRVPLEAA